MERRAEERWAVIRRLYEGDELTVAEIAVLARLTTRAIQHHARIENWPRRTGNGRVRHPRPAAAPLALADPGPAPKTGGAAAGTDRRAMIGRLWAALDRYLQDDEAGENDADPRRPQTLDVLVRTIERLSGMERGGEGEAETPAPADEAALRAELARRVEALAGEGGTEG